MSTPAGLLQHALTTDPSRPLVTFYDDASGERVELSVKTYANWVAKTANFLTGELMAEPADHVALALPPHWQTAVWLSACWSAGVIPVPLGEQPLGDRKIAGPAILVASERVLPSAMSDHQEAHTVAGLSLHALGAPLSDPPPDVIDYAAEVRAHGDHFEPWETPSPDDVALELPGGVLFTATNLVDEARETSARWEMEGGGRVLTTLEFSSIDGILAGVLVPLVSGGSSVICHNLDESTLNRRISSERVTAIVPASLAEAAGER